MKRYYGKITIVPVNLEFIDDILNSHIDTSYIEFESFIPSFRDYINQRLITSFKITKDTSNFILDIQFINHTSVSYTINSCSQISTYIDFPSPPHNTYYGYVSTYSDSSANENEMLYELRNYGFIEREENQEPFIYCYTLNSPKIRVDKILSPIKVITGEFNLPVSLRDFVLPLEIEDKLINFNYIYVSKLKRFYYIEKPTYIKNMVNLELHEDVLMTFRDLIRKQYAYVERNQYRYDRNLVDEFTKWDYEKSILTTNVPRISIFGSDSDQNLGGGWFVLKTVG